MKSQTAYFISSRNSECHAILCPSGAAKSFSGQLDEIDNGIIALLNENPGYTPVFKRYFLSDIQTQYTEVYRKNKESEYAVSIVGQPPLDGSEIAAWVILKTDVTISRKKILCIEDDGKHTHYRVADLRFGFDDIEMATEYSLACFGVELHLNGSSFLDGCIRTWLYVNDIDKNYHSVVRGRNNIFKFWGLSKETHFVASTGIEGEGLTHNPDMSFDAYGIKGLQASQVRFLEALTHLNAPHDYGVAFERGTSIDFDDRRQIYISGTASIDNRGQVIHEGNIEKQTERMLENIGALLKEAGADFDNVLSFIVYVRNREDYDSVRQIFEKRFPKTPTIIVRASVCRKDWLVETECVAVRKKG
ncbi:MAG: hypothetical protein LBS52_09500 [Dysgonamonadaceae bacterium]|jgi:enamine deaminase RidA (YjgF/YER057c/UK114 family)|nr:hypothetical protein [Dysgonamonadaceae bacterium]